MRENWTYKKLGEVCKIQYGFAFDSSCFCEDNKYPQLIRIRDVVRGYSETYYNGTIPEEYYVNQGEYLIGMDGEFNIAPWKSEKALLNQRVCKISSSDDTTLERYIYYQMQIILKHIEDETPYVTVKHLSAKRLNSVELPIPPLSEQQSIVAELDKINELISLKKAQLKDLDALAQSIFYDMFGDPIENEKGWEVKKLKDIVTDDCSISYGIVQPGDGVDNGVPVVRPVDMTHTFVKRSGLKQTTKEISDSYKRTILKGNEILMCVRGTTGLVALATEDIKDCNVTRGVTPIECNADNSRLYIYHLLLTAGIQQYIANYTKGIALKQINMQDVREIPLIIPPLSLQQEFAKRIELIELQKAQICSTIKDLETLLASRMQYWFD